MSNLKKYITHYWAKPIPTDKFDWSAVEDGYEPGDPIGYGSTEAGAMADLLSQIQDRDEERSCH